jgi:DegV family protein with EDD domain
MSPELIKELGITVLPTYLLFGTQSYRDGVDISTDEFYQRLLHEPVYPTTSQPTPQDFLMAFEKLSAKADGIICIHISSKLSGTLNSAEQARKSTTVATPIEIIDSQSVSMGLGLLVIAAARMAKAGKGMAEITEAVRRMVPQCRLFILFDTLEYLAKGGRIGKVKSLLGSILNVKPMVMVRDGELVPSGQVRSHARARTG